MRFGYPYWQRGLACSNCRRVIASVLIVDDYAGFRASARRLLESEGWEVVGEAADGASGLRCVEELAPDVVLLDIHLPDVDGRLVSRRISEGPSDSVVVLISSRGSAELGDSVEGAGAAGFICKGDLSGAALRELVA